MRSILVKTFAVGIIILFTGVSVSSGFAVDTKKNTIYNKNEDCGCYEVSDTDLIKVERLLDRVEVYSGLLLALSKYNPELKGVSELLSNKITLFINTCEVLFYPIIICLFLDIIGGIILSIGFLIGIIGQLFNYANMQIISNILNNIFGFFVGIWEDIGEFAEEIGCNGWKNNNFDSFLLINRNQIFNK